MNKTGSRARARITQMNIHANEWARARRIFFYECSRQLEARDTCSRCARVRPIRGARNRIIGEQIPPTTSATEHPKSLRFQSLVPLVYPDNDSSLGLSRFVAFCRVLTLRIRLAGRISPMERYIRYNSTQRALCQALTFIWSIISQYHQHSKLIILNTVKRRMKTRNSSKC